MKKFILSALLVVAFLVAAGTTALANTTRAVLPQPPGINSKGVFEYDDDGDGIPEAVIDAQDIYYLHQISK